MIVGRYSLASYITPVFDLYAFAPSLPELEMPFCWASGNSGELALNYTVQAQREAVSNARL